MKLNYFVNDTFSKVHNDLNKYMFIRGPVGSGKSSGCIWHCVLNSMLQHPQSDGVRRSRYGIIRASYPVLKSTVVKSWRQWFKELINIVYDVPIRGVMQIPHPDGETTVEIELVFIALDREEDVNKLQSMELTGCHMNEAAEIPRGVHQMVKSRINRYPPEIDGGAIYPFIVCDYNAVPTDHWLYKIAEEERPPKHSFYSQPPALLMVDAGEGDIIDAEGNCYIVNPEADNLGHWEPGDPRVKPSLRAKWSRDLNMWWVPNLADDYYEDQCYGAEPDWVNVMLLNNYGMVRQGKPVYPQYIDNVHYDGKLIKPQQGLPIIIGMDCGLTPAAAFTQLTPNGQLLIFDELVTEDCSIEEFCQDILKPHLENNYKGFRYQIVIDPAAIIRGQNDKKAAADILRENGLPFMFAYTNNDLPRREAVIYFLRKLGGFALGPQAMYLRKGFISGYQYGKKRSTLVNVRDTGIDMFKEKPEKSIYSHIHDGLQYACLEHTGGRNARRKKRKKAAEEARLNALNRRTPQVTIHNEPADSGAGY